MLIKLIHKNILLEGKVEDVDAFGFWLIMTFPYAVGERIVFDNSPEICEERIKDKAKDCLAKLYEKVILVRDNLEIFLRLHINFNDMISLQRIKLYKRVFYSDNERDLYLKSLNDYLDESYYELFDRYIVTDDKDVLALKKDMPPYQLKYIIEEVNNELKKRHRHYPKD